MNETDGKASSLLAQVDRGVLGLIQEFYRTVARRVRVRLVNRTNGDLAVRYGTVEISSLGRVMDRLHAQEGGAFATFRMNPGNVPGVIVIQGPLLYRLVGVMLGENPEGKAPLYSYRPLTPVDLRMAERVCGEILDGLVEACQMPRIPGFELEAVTGNPRVRVPLPRTTTVVEASLDFGPPDDPYGLVNVILPGQATGLLWPNRAAKNAVEARPTAEGLARIMPVMVDLVAELARVSMPLGKVKALEPGDLLELGRLGDVQLQVGGRPTFVGEAGERDGVRCVRVERRTLDLVAP